MSDYDITARDNASAAFRRIAEAAESAAAATRLAVLRKAAHPDDNDTDDTED